MGEAVAIMTGATEPGTAGDDQVVQQAGGGKHDAAEDGQGPEEGAFEPSDCDRARRTVAAPTTVGYGLDDAARADAAPADDARRGRRWPA